MNNRFLCCVFVSMVFCFPTVVAQISVAQLDLSEDVDAWYSQTIGIEHTPIAEGTYYKVQSQTVLEHQFFQHSAWMLGAITIENQTFGNLRMLYNTYQDLLIVENSGNYRATYHALRPNQKKIEQFVLEGNLFLNLQNNEPPFGKGFYQLVYEGERIRLLAKRIKTSSVGSQTIEYAEADVLFVQIGTQYYKYRNKKTLFDIFPENKTDIKKFIKTNLKYMKSKDEGDLAVVLDYCDSLVPSL